MFLIVFSSSLFAQEEQNEKDEMNNLGFFNITKISYTRVHFVQQQLFIPGEGSFDIELPNDKAQSFALQTINGYFVSPHLSFGLGVGMEGYTNPTFNTFPVFVDVRTYFEDDFNTTFLYLDLGTLAKISEDFKKGDVFSIGVGYKFFVGKKKKTSLIADIGYSVKSVSLTGERVRTSDDVIVVRGISLSFGVIF